MISIETRGVIRLELTEMDVRAIEKALRQRREIVLVRGALTVRTVPGGYPWHADMLVRVVWDCPWRTCSEWR